MTKELRAMLQKLEQTKAEVRSLLAEDKMQEAKEKMEEVRALQAKVDLQRELEETEARGLGGTELNDDGKVEKDMQQLTAEYRDIFLRGIRRKKITDEMRSIIREYERRAVMNEGETNPAIPDGDVGMVVPQDIQTRINELMREWNDLSQYVTVENVSTLSGSRVLETDANMTPFQVVDEYGEIQEIDNPKFTVVSYKLKKRAGYLPLTNELLADNDANLLGYVTNWIARKAAHTRNTQIIGLLNSALTPKTLPDVKAINKVLNVELDPAISRTAVILTNQDGFDWLDNQVDGMGRPILSEDFTQPGRKMFKGRPIVVVSNRHLPSDTQNALAPFYIGNLKQFMVLFNRPFFELASTREGGDAWRRDTTELRTIMRDDYVKWDGVAAVFGQLDISATP